MTQTALVIPSHGPLPPLAPGGTPQDEVLPNQSMGHLPVGLISPRAGFNPRLYRDPTAQQELTESIRAVGAVIEPITIRPNPECVGLYEVVAGHGRWIAATDLKLATIPVIVRHLSDRQALAIAMAENTHRTSMSPAEEALAARRMLDLHEGNRAEVLRLLGWRAQKLDARLLLLHATPSVLKALAERRIDLGHAEHLSPLTPANQEKGLEAIFKHKLSVPELHKHIAAFALDLATAVFDKSGCQACPHNTTRQATLFEAHVGTGRCAQPSCFHGKTREHVEQLRTSLKDSYNVVYIDHEKEPASYHVLLKKDVGLEQFEQGCKGCKHFGCLISTHPGTVGQITGEVCFGPDCRQEKILAYQATLKMAAPVVVAPEISSSQTPSTARATVIPKKTPTAAAQPKRVEDFIHAVHRRAAAAEVRANPKMCKVYAVLALANELGELNRPDSNDDPLARHGIHRHRGGDPRVALIDSLFSVEESVLDDLIATYASAIAGRAKNDITTSDYLKAAQATLRALQAPLEAHFKVDAPFLTVHTKAGIESVLREAGFVTHYNRNEPARFQKLMARKHEEIVREVMESGFQFEGFVPREVRIAS